MPDKERQRLLNSIERIAESTEQIAKAFEDFMDEVKKEHKAQKPKKRSTGKCPSK